MIGARALKTPVLKTVSVPLTRLEILRLKNLILNIDQNTSDMVLWMKLCNADMRHVARHGRTK